jgi:acetylornithine deacetylase/succinyl-diaminopimelate desuccinylase-like protein
MATAAVSYAHENKDRFIQELKNFLSIPSISTLEEHKGDIQKAAQMCADELKRIGFENVEVIPTQGHPLVYADWLHAAGKPTALCYAHYDVQPAEPLDEWKSPPFIHKDAYPVKGDNADAVKSAWSEPIERDNNLYARGAVDDKGQLWMQVKAYESLFQAGKGKLPINIRVLLEGEEEVGGESIEAFIKQNATSPKLKADFALVTDTELFAPDLPTLCVGLRGLVYTEVEAQGSKVDLHSGMYGGAAPNAIFGLIEILSRLKDADGKVLIPGFYDQVEKPTEAELKAWESLPFDEKEYREKEVGSDVLTGEPSYSVLYRTWARPTLEVHGIAGGFVGAGAKTVIPARATAKVSMRMVPNQNPDDILKKFTDYVKKIAPKGIKTKVKVLSKGPACVISTDNKFAKASVQAMHEVFGKDTVYIRSGGSIPIVTQFEKDLKIPSIMMGMGLPDDNLHAPNEKFHIPNFHRGVESLIRFFQKLGE